MSLPKKGLRKITVNNFRYAWNATGNDGWISLSIAPLDNEGQLLTSIFDYHSKVTDIWKNQSGDTVTSMKQQFIITPYIVRQVILYGLGKGWNPKEKGPQFDLGPMDKFIDLNIDNVNIK